jgi:hypothetical protein
MAEPTFYFDTLIPFEYTCVFHNKGKGQNDILYRLHERSLLRIGRHMAIDCLSHLTIHASSIF